MKDPLAELLSSRVRATVLSWFVVHPGGASLTELARALDLSVSSVQHECYKLERLGVLAGRREGSSRRYRPAADSVLVEPLMRLVLAAHGAESLLAAALREIPGLDRALLVPSNGAAGMAGMAEIDPTYLVMIGKVPLEQLDAALDQATTLLDLPPDRLALAFYRPDDWRARIAEGHPLVRHLLVTPHRILVGDDEAGLTAGRGPQDPCSTEKSG